MGKGPPTVASTLFRWGVRELIVSSSNENRAASCIQGKASYHSGIPSECPRIRRELQPLGQLSSEILISRETSATLYDNRIGIKRETDVIGGRVRGQRAANTVPAIIAAGRERYREVRQLTSRCDQYGATRNSRVYRHPNGIGC